MTIVSSPWSLDPACRCALLESQAQTGPRQKLTIVSSPGSLNPTYRCTQIGALVLSMVWVCRQDIFCWPPYLHAGANIRFEAENVYLWGPDVATPLTAASAAYSQGRLHKVGGFKKNMVDIFLSGVTFLSWRGRPRSEKKGLDIQPLPLE